MAQSLSFVVLAIISCLCCIVIAQSTPLVRPEIDTLVDGALQPVIASIDTAIQVENIAEANYLDQVKKIYQDTGVAGNISGVAYEVTFSLYKMLGINQQEYNNIKQATDQALAGISEAVQRLTAGSGLDVMQLLQELFQKLGDDAASIIHRNNQKLNRIIYDGGTTALHLNRQSH